MRPRTPRPLARVATRGGQQSITGWRDAEHRPPSVAPPRPPSTQTAERDVHVEQGPQDDEQAGNGSPNRSAGHQGNRQLGDDPAPIIRSSPGGSVRSGEVRQGRPNSEVPGHRPAGPRGAGAEPTRRSRRRPHRAAEAAGRGGDDHKTAAHDTSLLRLLDGGTRPGPRPSECGSKWLIESGRRSRPRRWPSPRKRRGPRRSPPSGEAGDADLGPRPGPRQPLPRPRSPATCATGSTAPGCWRTSATLVPRLRAGRRGSASWRSRRCRPSTGTRRPGWVMPHQIR
jgi:hypothetical protein